MHVWFGTRNAGNWVIAGNRPESLAAYAAETDSSGLVKDVDLEREAVESGLCASRSDYIRLLHETAIVLAKSRISMLLSGADASIMQAVKSLDTVNDSYNEVSERLTEWYGIKYPEVRLRPHELINDILESGAQDEDFKAIRSLASTARTLFEERKCLESYVTACMEDVAPNLTDVLGPLLGARLIARAGGLDKLSKMPAGSIQVMGSGEALFKHLREGTPSPKHGFIYRHPLISGAPKRNRGKLSRMIAGKAAIAARVDYYSGERQALGAEVREKSARIRSRSGGRKHDNK